MDIEQMRPLSVPFAPVTCKRGSTFIRRVVFS